jgi:transmembrane sensor
VTAGLDPTRQAVAEEAAKWLLAAPAADAPQRAAFVAWLKSSPLHVEEFLFATATLKELRAAASPDPREIERVIAEALTGGTANVVALYPTEPAITEEASGTRGVWRGIRPMAAAAALALIALFGGFWAYTRSVESQVYSTRVGEQRTIRLADGSLISMNALSQLQVRYSRKAREVEIGQGDAIFHVAHQPGRPFRVHVDAVTIEAIGTRFSVSRRGHEATVSMLEGKVRAATENMNAPALTLIAGEQARIVSGHIRRSADADVAQAVAWQERRLVFRDQSLERIVEEFGRYSPRRIDLEGPAAREQRITGTFDADDPEALVLFLESMENLSVERRGENWIVRSR